jgi:hypothetical protein
MAFSATEKSAPARLRREHSGNSEETTMDKLLTMLTGLVAVASLIIPSPTQADDFNELDCGWPIALSPVGPGNLQGPDSASRYWIMPLDMTKYQAMTIHGAYPEVRYFSIVAYDVTDDKAFSIAGHLFDAQIEPDKGSANPFVSKGTGTYTVVVSRTPPPSGNFVQANSNLVWVALRLYVADADPSLGGKSLMGKVPLPTVTLKDSNGNSRVLPTCSPVNKWSDVSAYAQYIFPPQSVLIGDEGTPNGDRLWFASPAQPPQILWPNPDASYVLMMPGKEYQAGRLMVIRGKAPGYPDTFNGSAIWQPASGFRSVDVRYWAVCNMDLAPPIPVVECATDLDLRLQGQYYTIVVSDDRQRPDWLRPNINWLPWGDEQYQKLFAMRHILPSPDFAYDVQDARRQSNCLFEFDFPSLPARSVIDNAGPFCEAVMGEYYPVALWCDKATFVAGGFDACLRDAD